MKIHTYIPTYRRARNQQAVNFLTPEELENVTVVTTTDSVATYRKHNPNVPNVVGVDIKGISPTRQWIMEDARKRGLDLVVHFDDDLVFRQRIFKDGKPLYRRFKGSFTEAIKMTQELFKADENLGVVGYAHTQQIRNLKHEQDFEPSLRFWSAHAWRLDAYEAVDAQFDDVVYMEDFHMHLAMLDAGWGAVITSKVAVEERLPSQASGGCKATGRNAHTQTEAAQLLHELWPKFTKLRPKTLETFGDETFYDVTVQWAKARKAGERS